MQTQTHSVAVVARLKAHPARIVKESSPFGGFEEYFLAVTRCIRVFRVVKELREAVLNVLQAHIGQGAGRELSVNTFGSLGDGGRNQIYELWSRPLSPLYRRR